MPFALVLIERSDPDAEKLFPEFRSQIPFEEFTLEAGVYVFNDSAWLFDLSIAMEKCAMLIAAAGQLNLHVLHLSDIETRMAMVSTPKSVRMDQFLKPRRVST